MVSLSHDARQPLEDARVLPLALAGGLLAVAVAFLYAPLWSVCWTEWWRDESAYSHGVLVPPLALLMVWHRREEIGRAVRRPAPSGLLLVILGLALQLFGRWAHSTMVSWASFLVLVPGGIAFIAGWRAAARLLPPVLYLTFMIPMSQMLTQPIVFGAQIVSTRIAEMLLRGMGFEIQRLGTVLQMESYTLQVALPCSGFKTLIALSAFAGCFVYLLRGSLPKKLLLFGAALVLSLAVNGLRISLVGLAGELVSTDAGTWIHDNGGLPVCALALGGLYLLAKLLKCPLELGERTPPSSGQAPATEPVGTPASGPGTAKRSLALRALSPAAIATLAVLIGATSALAARLPTLQTEARPGEQRATQLARSFGLWTGTDQEVAPDVQRALPTAHIFSRRYACPMGSVDVTIVAGSDATALHDPHDCLTGDGWHFISERPRDVDTGRPGASIRVRDVVMARGPMRARMWYWYAVGSDVYDRTLPARLGLLRTRLTEGRRRRAEFVRLIVAGETDSARTTLMLADLARQIAGR